MGLGPENRKTDFELVTPKSGISKKALRPSSFNAFFNNTTIVIFCDLSGNLFKFWADLYVIPRFSVSIIGDQFLFDYSALPERPVTPSESPRLRCCKSLGQYFG